jgi:hypothetical protein
MQGYDYQGAIKAGANPTDVLNYMASKTGYDATGAVKAGADQNDVMSYMANLNPSPEVNPQVADTYSKMNGGFASETIKNATDFANKTNQDYQSSLMSGLLPVNPSDNSNPIVNGLKAGANVLGDVPTALKGLSNIVMHPIDTIDSITKDPTMLLGPAVQQITTGLESAFNTGNISDFFKGLQGASTAFTNHPLLSVLPFLAMGEGLDSVTDFAKNPLEAVKGASQDVAGKVMGTATKAVNTILSPLDALKSVASYVKSPFAMLADKLNTVANLEKNNALFADKVNKVISDASTAKESALEQLKGIDQNSTQAGILGNEIGKQDLAIKNANELKENQLNSSLKSVENLKEISMGGNPVSSMGGTVADTLTSVLKNVKQGFSDLLPKSSYPSLKSVIDGLTEFSKEVAQGTNKPLQTAISDKIAQLGDKEAVRGIYQNGGDAKAVEQTLARRGQVGADVTPVSASFLKTTLQGELYDSLVKSNPSYAKVWQDTVAPKIDEAIKADLSPEQSDAYDTLNGQYKALDGGSLANKFSEANTSARVLTLMKSPEVTDALNTIHPALSDVAKQTVMKSVLENNLEGKSYDPQGLIKSLDENSPALDQGEYLNVKSMALRLQELHEQMGTIKNSQSVLGSTPADIFNNLSKTDSIKGLTEFSNTAGLSPLQAGSLFIKGAAETIDPQFAQTGKFTISKDYAQDVENIKALDNKLQSFGGNTPETEAVREAAFGKDGMQALDDLHNARLNLEELAREKATGAVKRAIKVIGGGVMLHLGFLFTGSRMIKGGLELGKDVSREILGNASREGEAPPPIPKEPSGGVLKGASAIAPASSNAENENEGGQ